jgi:sporulation protein YlmC with PRC-barrel domain
VQPSQNPKSQDNTADKAIKPDQTGNTGATGTNSNSAAAPSAAPTASAAANGQESSGSQASESPPIVGNPKAKDQSGSTVQPSPAAADASPSPAPDQGVGNRAMSITSLMPEETLQSKDGKYLAAIEQHKVTIKDQASQEIIFTSERVWIESDKVTLLEWSDDGKLTYQVINDTSTQNFEIDAVHKSEALLK